MRLASVVVVFALGWIFHGRNLPPPARVIRSVAAPLRSVVSPPPSASAQKPTAPEQADPPETPPRGADRDELLRERLSGSIEEVLQSLAEIGKNRPALAIDLVQSLGRTDTEKSEWVTNMMQQWANRDPQAAWQWLGQLSPTRMDELAGGSLNGLVLNAMAARDPQMLLANVDILLRQGNSIESISTPVALHLGLQALVEHGDTDLARNAVEEWVRDPHKLKVDAAAYETVAISMGTTAPADAGAWLRSMPVSEDRNAAIATF
jgi:hypothetical protein